MSFRKSARIVSTVWIVVADRSSARIFAAEGPGLENFREVADMVNPQGSLHGRDVYPDRFGRDHAPDGHGFSESPPTDLPHYEAELFGQHIIKQLEEGRTHNQFGQLVVVAAPLMLGMLRKHYSPPLKKLVEAELDKELTQANGADVLKHVRQALELVATER